ncbi:hypothetical protein RSSM_02565 [Rhodopirellula sallentina SM41]|uniref:Uncharacterized protein n=1 Tax=Rhodopirellula sallentina SM41 TaxID=1263870 RepID=M5UDR6_9BACT|nr:hypothetical protein RSSM_02565 [Rhodopirellula sallentina SM41]
MLNQHHRVLFMSRLPSTGVPQHGFDLRNFEFQLQDELTLKKNSSRQCYASLLALLEQSAHGTT